MPKWTATGFENMWSKPGGFGSQISNWHKGVQKQEENYFLTEAERQKWIANMISGVATQTQQETLGAEERLAREGASEATKGAAARGAAYSGKMAEKEGIQNIEMFAEQFNQRGQAAMDQYKLALKQMELEREKMEKAEEMQNQSDWMNLLGGLGMAAGYFFQPLSAKWFG